MSQPVLAPQTSHDSVAVRLRRTVAWRTRTATARWRALPDFVVLGGQRCGTTSLHEALSGHRRIKSPFQQEVHYFDLHYRKDIRWYRANFPLEVGRRGSVTFETTPNYLAGEDVPRLMSTVVPDTKLIALLRNPIERTFSSWKLRTREGSEDRPFEQAVADELAKVPRGGEGLDADRKHLLQRAKRWAYVEKSCYDEHLERWFAHFDRTQILILQSEDLFADPDSSLAQIQEFLRIDPDPSITFPQVNATPTSTIDPTFRRELSDYFVPHVARLVDMTGQDFDWS